MFLRRVLACATLAVAAASGSVTARAAAYPDPPPDPTVPMNGGLYVATQRWIDPQIAVSRVPVEQKTAIHRFDVSDPDRTTFAASGEVEGYLLNQFSLSEYRGRLRVATTSRPI